MASGSAAPRPPVQGGGIGQYVIEVEYRPAHPGEGIGVVIDRSRRRAGADAAGLPLPKQPGRSLRAPVRAVACAAQESDGLLAP
jgi:hypothetical protein